jgi:hypothetical protein
MKSDLADSLPSLMKNFIKIMVAIAIGFVALYSFIFLQLKQKESQLTSYGNVTDSAIGNFLENIPESDSIKVSKLNNTLSFTVKDGENSKLNADFFDNKDSSYFLNASNLQEGTLQDSVFSAWKDLENEGYVANGKIKADFLPAGNGGTATTIKWSSIQDRPAGLDDGDDSNSLTETQVETYVTNAAIDLAAGTTLQGSSVVTEGWINTQNYLTSVNYSQITNGTNVYLDYRPNNIKCVNSQFLQYNAPLERWVCGDNTGTSATPTWGSISGTLTLQTDLKNALDGKLGITQNFTGDLSGTYNAIVVSDDSHNHTGSTVSGLSTGNFTSANISQWTNNAGYITNDTSVAKNDLSDGGTLGFSWGLSELASEVMAQGENISLLNNNAGYITGLNHSQLTNGAGIYFDYRPNNTACAQNQVLKYDTSLTR